MKRPSLPSLLAFVITLLLAVLFAPVAEAQKPTPGQNINIVSGPVQLKDPSTGYVTILGDPFLQRQNEPSIALSTVDPSHLLAGANDYRAVDIPFPDVISNKLVGDAWCGWFYSPDGGISWQSTLLPGYPQDNKPLGMASPLKGLKACSDPTVRPGPGGMFFYSGIAFNRDTNQSALFMSRFIDLADSESGNVALNTASIRYVDTTVLDIGTPGQFVDKTWNAVYLQPGSGTCTIQVPVGVSGTQTQSVTVPAMTVYAVWSRFTGANSSKIMVTQSQSCGNPGTYGALFKLSESNSINQGTAVAVDQANGNVHFSWRRFAASNQPDAIMAVRCGSSLKSCSKAIDVTANMPASQQASLNFKPFKPLDQLSTQTTFRTNSMPAIAVSVDKSNVTRIHIAFAAKNANGDSRILLASSYDGVNWPGTQIQPVEPNPIGDDAGNLWGLAGHGAQLMPAMTFSEGKLVIAYYFSHFDHTVGLFQPYDPINFTPDPNTGKFFTESRSPRGELDPSSPNYNPAAVYSNLDDGYMVTRRHTMDVRMVQADVNDLTFPSPSASATVSRYVFGLLSTTLGDIFADYQANPPDLALFASGNNAFIGDYIDVAGSMFVQGSPWKANNAPNKASVHYIVWADNRDVQPPKDGNYANFTAIGATAGAQSFFDPTQTYAQTCAPGQAGNKDQNVYVSQLTQGFVFSVPQNMKPLGYDPNHPGQLLDRAFTALLNNFTKDPMSVRLTISSQPPDAPAGRASFNQNTLLTTTDVSVPAHSGIAQAIFLRSSKVDASVQVTATEITGPGGTPVAGGFSTFVVLNPPGSVKTLLQPDGVPPNLDITTQEVYNAGVKSAGVKSAGVKSAGVKSAGVKSAGVKSAGVKSAGVKSAGVKSTTIADLDPNAASSVTVNGNEVDPTIASSCIATSDPNGFTTDAFYTLTNQGNTAATYTISLLGSVPAGACVQLIVAKPGAGVTTDPTSQVCELVQQDEVVVLASITDLSQFQNLSVSVPPGDLRLIVIRGASIGIVLDTTENTVPAVTPPTNSDGSGGTTAVPLFITTTTLPDGAFATPYSPTTLQAISGTPPYTWSALPPPVPNPNNLTSLDQLGLTLDPNTGQITGTPNTVGTFTFKVQVCDATLPQGALCDSNAPFESSARKTLTLTVKKAATTTTITSDNPDPSVVGQTVTVNFTVTATPPASGSPTGNVTVTVNDGSNASCTAPASAAGSCTITLTQVGTWTLTATYPGDANYSGSSDTESHVVNKAPTTTTITSDAPDPSIVGQPITVTFTVTPQSGSGTPTGNVTVSDGPASCTATVAAGSCTLTLNTVGTRTLTATYAGDNNYNGSSDTESHQVFYQFVGFFSPNALADTCTLPSPPNSCFQSYSGTANYGSAVPLKFRLTDFSGVPVTDVTQVLSIVAVYNGSTCSGPPSGPSYGIWSPTTGGTGKSAFRWDATNQQFALSWDSSKAGSGAGCYSVQVQPKDGSPPKATYIQLQ